MDTRNEIREFLTSRRARITPEQADLTWTATIDEEISHADHEERDRHRTGAE